MRACSYLGSSWRGTFRIELDTAQQYLDDAVPRSDWHRKQAKLRTT